MTFVLSGKRKALLLCCCGPFGVQPSPDLLCVGHERSDDRALKKGEKQ